MELEVLDVVVVALAPTSSSRLATRRSILERLYPVKSKPRVSLTNSSNGSSEVSARRRSSVVVHFSSISSSRSRTVVAARASAPRNVLRLLLSLRRAAAEAERGSLLLAVRQLIRHPLEQDPAVLEHTDRRPERCLDVVALRGHEAVRRVAMAEATFPLGDPGLAPLGEERRGIRGRLS